MRSTDSTNLPEAVDVVDTDDGPGMARAVIIVADQTGSASAGTTQAGMAALGYQQIIEPAVAMPLAAPASTKIVIAQNNGSQPARFLSFANPTATTGLRLLPGDMMVLSDSTVANTKFIREAAGVTLDVAYFG